jgi:hypothetical protein
MENDAVFVDCAKVGGILRCFFFCSEKTAVFETGTERQAGPDKKTFGVLLFYARGNQRGFAPDKSKLR